MDRSREFYAAHGHDKPYEWSHYDDVSFMFLKKSLAECRVGLVTKAGKPKAAGDILELLIPRELYDEPANPPPQRLFTDDLSWDKKRSTRTMSTALCR